MNHKKKISLDDIQEEGSLSLLALGYQGVMVWRQKKLKRSVLNSDILVGPVIEGKEVKINIVGSDEEE